MSTAEPSIFERIADDVERRAGRAALDSRADGRRRSVLLSRERVTIDRSFRGIAMRLSVPVSAYRGVAVGVRASEAGGFVYELKLAHRDPELSVLLDENRDEARIWAGWRDAAGFFGLPALIERADGLQSWCSAAATPAPSGRRPKRRIRPGIVARRVARPEAAATVHREREIVAPD